MSPQATARPTLREQQLKLREDVILREVNALLAEKGYDLMTVDEVAARVGIAKPSLYKHFESKEALAAAAMVRLLERTRAAIEAQPADAAPIDRLKGVVRWALHEHLRGQMPSLPSTRSTLRDSLVRHPGYIDLLIDVSDRLGAWIADAQRKKALAPRLPPEAILYTLFARACDPVSDYLKLSGNFSDDEIVDLVTATCFDGLAARRD
ncbi:MAG: TetR/AcrR family transcriptional regulator [Burkholderiaceae bacterium]|jgi:TetR/AcrR family transcriptional regulator of autoinduction and epiphytic fitness|nr:TetR/AcrR family transcriptional regulator [Burkholderiaceae bacterium]MDH5209291.1 TetR/AcrR family transcriptional regulator [Burkholderiaceae bacterium]